MKTRLVPLLLTLLLVGCSGPQLAASGDDVFAQAVEASLDEDHKLTAAAAHKYMSETSPDDPRYDRAQRLLANAVEELGLTYAASIWYLDVASSRRDPEVIADAVRGLERIVLEHPYNEHLLIDGFVATAEITGLPPRQQAFVHFYQGLDSLKRGRRDWVQQLFAMIPKDDPYKLRAQQVLAVDLIVNYDLDEAQRRLESMLERDELPEDVRLELRRTLARIEFEKAHYDRALGHYEEIRATAKDDPSLLLEMAWCHFYLGNLERALGLLIALDAPNYADLIAPERFLLEALALKNLCQFEPARLAAVRLRERHGDALEDLYRGVPLEESEALRRAASRRPGSAEVIRYRERIRWEAEKVEGLERAFGEDLYAALKRMYAHANEEAARRETAGVRNEMRRVSQELLAAEEGTRLILHELGVALLRGRKRNVPTGLDDEQAVGPLDVVYRFEGEFWTDEVDDLVVRMEDRCID